ncbi:NADH-quinone oxidoreductase subunit H, partial [bacterium]|nr:NADH-quinone oxidoreductase subunit H [bacterium]MBU1024594.1 NADH-quinone oxidoreductase subunit H [bacterium]
MGEWILQKSYELGLKANLEGFWGFFWHDAWFVIVGILIFAGVVLPLILAVAYLTFLERKILAWAHYRLGPNRAGWQGLLQPLCDAVKLLVKEDIVPIQADKYVWFIAPIVAFAPMVACFLAIPLSNATVLIQTPSQENYKVLFEVPMIGADIGIGLMFILSLSSLVVVGIFTAGFGSNNKYSMFGGVRSAGQIISYEVPIIICLLSVILLTGSMSTVNIVKAQRYVSSSDTNSYLKIDYLRSMIFDFNMLDFRDWVVMERFLKDPASDGEDEKLVEEWSKYKENVYVEFEAISGVTEEEKISKGTEFTLPGQRLHLGYSNYQKTAGSPRLPFIIPLLIAFIIYFIAGVAESNRSPFDLPEGESEIVAGFHTEYTGIKFGLFFLGEYGNMILISAIAVTCFLGGWLGPALPFMKPIANFVGQYLYYFAWFFIKVLLLVSVMVWFRATFPRLRVDQLTDFAWKVLLPIALINLLIVGYFHFSDWNLHTMGETNWVLWYGNIAKLFKYPAVRLMMVLFFLPILSDVLYPYR